MSAAGLQRRPGRSVPRTGIGTWTARRGQRPQVDGSSARQLEEPAPDVVDATGSTRAPLSVVPGRAGRRRVSAVVLSLLALVIALGSILVLNIQISDGQYRLVELRAQEQALRQHNESLTQDLEFYSAPQNLAVMATDLGMVPARDFGTVDLTEGTVEGDPLPAEPREEHGVLVEHAYQTGSEAADLAAERAEERARAEAEQQRESAEQAAREAGAAATGAQPDGSLPAPQLRTPGE